MCPWGSSGGEMPDSREGSLPQVRLLAPAESSDLLRTLARLVHSPPSTEALRGLLWVGTCRLCPAEARAGVPRAEPSRAHAGGLSSSCEDPRRDHGPVRRSDRQALVFSDSGSSSTSSAPADEVPSSRELGAVFLFLPGHSMPAPRAFKHGRAAQSRAKEARAGRGLAEEQGHVPRESLPDRPPEESRVPMLSRPSVKTASWTASPRPS